MIDRKRSCSVSRTRRVVAKQVARVELEVLEVERRLALLRRGVLGREQVEQLLQELAVARCELLEGRLLQPVSCAHGTRRRARRVAGRSRSSSCSGFEPSASAALARGELLCRRVGIGREQRRGGLQLGEALGHAGVLARARAGRSRPAERSVS